MTRGAFLLLILLLLAGTAQAQKGLVITNVTITEEGVETRGIDVTALVTSSPVKGRVVLYEEGGIRIGAWVRTITHHVKPGSMERGTVSIAIVLDLVAHGHREKREVGQVFRPDEERVMHIEEKFNARTGMGHKKITVSFVGHVE